MPRLIVLRASPVAIAVAETPPRPCASASLAANSRRARSSRKAVAFRQRERMSAISITQPS